MCVSVYTYVYILIHSVYKYVYIYIYKESAHSAGDADSITGLGRTPGKGNGNSLQYSCLGNPMDRGAWQATVHGITKELDYVYLSVYIWRIDTLKLWCWRRFLRVLWTAMRSNQLILKEINLQYLLEGLKLKLQYFGHLMQRAKSLGRKPNSLEKTLMLGKI